MKKIDHDIVLAYLLVFLLFTLMLPSFVGFALTIISTVLCVLTIFLILYCKQNAKEKGITFSESALELKNTLDKILKNYDKKD